MKYFISLLLALFLAILLSQQIKIIAYQKNKIEMLQAVNKDAIRQNKEKDIRIDKISQIVSNIATDYPVVGEGLQEVLIDIKEGISIGIDQKLADLPDDMSSLIVSQKIETHGLLKYQVAFKGYIYPITSDQAYIPEKWGEYGWRPKLFNENYEYVYTESVKSNVWAMHGAWDILNPYHPEILASNDGIISKIGQDEKGGNYIIITHKINGYPLRRTKYFHLADIKVKLKEQVLKGQIIGIMGRSGKAITAAHLHFEFEEWDGRRWVNKNFLIGTTHNRSYVSGYYWYNHDEKWRMKVL
jgi:murein DD-endopeptidase MepM/ murein hydrolase activator NlpD